MSSSSSPVVVLNVAEKPSVARALQAVFGRLPGAVRRNDNHHGRGGGRPAGSNEVFTHDHVSFPSVLQQTGVDDGRRDIPVVPHTMITTSVRGHLASQDFAKQQYGWNKCDPATLLSPDTPIETSYRDDMQPLEQCLTRLARTAQVLILWLDCDREGEAIGDEVRTVCLKATAGSSRRRPLEVFRARFSTVLEPEIRRALHRLGRVNEHFVQAVQARSELDLRVGAAFTRFQTMRLQRKFDGLADQGVVSYGPCQFPTLGFVVERWARIETFIPEDFWFLSMELKTAEEDPASRPPPHAGGSTHGRTITLTWKRGHLFDQWITTVLYESCLDAGPAVVTSLTGRPKNKWRPVPLATVELQKRASRYLRIGSETLMSAAEELYQQGYISYPRTETEKFRPEFAHRPLIQQLSTIPGEVGAYAAKLLDAGQQNFQRPRNGQHDDQAHPPITPCKAVDPNSISDATKRNVYILVVKHYLACCSRDAVGRETQLTVKLGTEEFTATGLMVLEKNWLEIYSPWERWSTGQGEIPNLQVGSRVTPHSLVMKEGRTTPPQFISEVELISLMDRNGIGTDATIAQHISTIQERRYAEKDPSQRFHPTKLGIALVEGYNSMGYQLNKPDLRREVEAECNLVAAGQKTKDQIVVPILAKMRAIFERAVNEAHKLDEAVARHFSRLGSSNEATQVVQANFSTCGACGNAMSLKQERQNRGHGARRKLVYCNTCSAGWNLPRGVARPKTRDDRNGGPAMTCPICNYQVIQISRGDGYEGNGYHLCPKCFSDAPIEHGGAQNSEFRCFNCRHPSCSLATGMQNSDTEVFTCPFCFPNGARPPNQDQGKVCLRKTSRGFVLSCNRYSGGNDRCWYTIWLPKECSAVSVPTGDENRNDAVCSNCSTPNRVVRPICIEWKPGSVPPHYGPHTQTCILCDGSLRRDLNINLPQPGQVQSRPRATAGRGGRGRGNTGRGGGRTGGRGGRGGNGGGGGIVCYNCQQPGHFANACPNR
jgi:DNA topoisomerase-3